MNRYRIHTPRITLEVSEEGEFVLYSDIENELETLRASNTIKQANIERLEAENAKLIAEREVNKLKAKYFDDCKARLNANGFDSFEDLVGEYGANKRQLEFLKSEREAMMKQDPVYQYHNSGNSWCDCNKNVYDAMKDEYRRIVYIGPLPAQQIPERYKFENKKGHIVVTCPDLSEEIVYADEPLFELMSLLSASQPKGDV